MTEHEQQEQEYNLVYLSDFSLEQVEQLIVSLSFRLSHDAHINAAEHSGIKSLAVKLRALAAAKRSEVKRAALAARCPSCDEE